MASGWIHGPFTLARNTFGAPVTQKRAWMQRRPSNCSSMLGGAHRLHAIDDGGLRSVPRPRTRAAAESSVAAALLRGRQRAAGAPASFWLMSKPRTARVYR